MGLLGPTELYPAGAAGVTTRMVELATGVRVRVVESGPVGGMPVVMLHGWGASLYMFRDALRLLPLLGFRAIAVDLRGYGLSDHPAEQGSYTLDRYLADLDALLSSLNIESVVLIGQSMGGGVALHYALRHPQRVRRLVLINPVGLVSIGWVSAMRLVPRAPMESLGARILPRWLTRFILRHLAFGDASCVSERDVDENWALTQLPGFVRAVRAGIADFNWGPLSAAESASLKVPTLVIIGTNDRVVRHARRAAERLANARVVSLQGGHCVHEENPAAVYRLIGEFLREG